jgi:hypothetical protein
VYNRNDIMMYLKKNDRLEEFEQLVPIGSRDFIALFLESLADTYSNLGEMEKATEIESLIPLLQIEKID